MPSSSLFTDNNPTAPNKIPEWLTVRLIQYIGWVLNLWVFMCAFLCAGYTYLYSTQYCGGSFIKPHPLLREFPLSLWFSHRKCIVESVKSEIVTGRWRGSSTNLRLALLKMYQGQMEDLSGDQMNCERQELSFRFGQHRPRVHIHTHMHAHIHTHTHKYNRGKTVSAYILWEAKCAKES